MLENAVFSELTCKTPNLHFPDVDFVNRVTYTVVSDQYQLYTKFPQSWQTCMGQGLQATVAGFHSLPLTFQASSGLSQASEFLNFIYCCPSHGNKNI